MAFDTGFIKLLLTALLFTIFVKTEAITLDDNQSKGGITELSNYLNILDRK
jgi:hypothetical protein